MLMGEKLPGLTRWTGRVNGPQRSQSLGHHRPPWGSPAFPGRDHLIPRGRSPARGRQGRFRRTRGGGDGARAPGAARPSRARPAPPALRTPAHTRARARARSKAGASQEAEEPCGRLGASSFVAFARSPGPGAGLLPRTLQPEARRETQGSAPRRAGRRTRRAWAAGLGLRAGCGGAALTCGRRRRAGQRAPGAQAARGPGGRRRSGPGRPSALLRGGSGRAPGAGRAELATSIL